MEHCKICRNKNWVEVLELIQEGAHILTFILYFIPANTFLDYHHSWDLDYRWVTQTPPMDVIKYSHNTQK